ncbi:chordin-like protein 2 isoform X3 [Microcaecilia unicolor]|uniref:Chordin-like protein 2 isoform X3 n=1 Tax=Microcaecilia unicolor TaxID=1415580 RepID=A0A6P7XPV6_9AMPH|nr:chordin-like protein 2 isoform X3 [Microcaecilia unicolor]
MAPDLPEVCLLLGFSALLLASETEGRARARPDMFCIFHGKRYSLGESWHPYLEPYGVMYCLRCLCSQQNASVSCHRIKCPLLHCISTMTEPRQCCPRCVEPRTPSGLRAPVKSCQYNGTVYQQGQMFASSDLFPARQPDQCVLCSCSDGQIYCGLMTCPEVVCSSPFTLTDFCCQVCKESSIEKSLEEEPLHLNRGVRYSQDQCLSELLNKKSFGGTALSISSSSLGINARTFKHKGGGTTIKIVLRGKHKKACIYNGKTYSHGEVWHPVFRSFGTLPCILCTCKDGKQDCHRVTCPNEYPCEYPEKVEGKCCKICQDQEPKGEPEKDCNRKRSFRRGGHLCSETARRNISIDSHREGGEARI